jgi:NAD(P)-dependent dehydrogenase (short-subunit alcohol dehydrogenase family)
MSIDLSDRVAVVTGGTGALGAAVTGRLLAAGAVVHVTWIVESELDAFAHRDAVTLHHIDAADEDAMTGLYSDLGSCWASVHVVGGFAMAPIDATSLDDFVRMHTLNTVTCFLGCREAVRAMRRTGGGGRIVNVAARPVESPVGGMIAYTTAKAGVASLSRCLADEVRGDGILVNAVLPSIMDTPANRAAMPDADHASWPAVDEIAETIAFLASPANTSTSGALVPVYGKA